MYFSCYTYIHSGLHNNIHTGGIKMEQIDMMTIPESAETLRVSEVTIRKWVRERRLPHLKLGSRVFVKQEDIVDFIKKNYHPARKERGNNV